MRRAKQNNSPDGAMNLSRLMLALFVFSILFSLPLVVYFLDRVGNEAKMRDEYQRLSAEVERNTRCITQLEAALAYVQTDQFVEQWAREHERMGKSGETVVIPYTSAPLVSAAHPWWEDRVNCRD
jgi:cell division protein FtsB